MSRDSDADAVDERFCCEKVMNFIKLRFSDNESEEEVNISSRLLGTFSSLSSGIVEEESFWSRNIESRAFNSRYSLILVFARQDTMSEEE